MSAGRPDPPATEARPARGPARDGRPVRRRSWAEVRWRQFRNAPRPVVRAVLASLSVASVLAIAYVAYDIALSRGVALPGGDLRLLAITAYVVIVLVVGSLVTYLVVPQPGPREAGVPRRRSAWSAALGFFAAVPIAYLVMVVATQLVRPAFG